MKVVLIRHPAPLIEPGICYGRLDIPLHPKAAKDVDHIARDPALHGIRRVWSSPASRCLIVADRLKASIVPLEPVRRRRAHRTGCNSLFGLAVHASGDSTSCDRALTIDTRLQELDFGDWEGRQWDTIDVNDLDRWAASPLSFAPPHGESGAAILARMRAFYADLLRDQIDCVVVSHGGPLKILTALFDGRPVDLLAAAPPLGSVRTIIQRVRDHPSVQAGSQSAVCGI